MGVSVVAAGHGEQLGAARHTFGELQRGVDGFSAGIEKVHAIQFRGQGGAQQLAGSGLGSLKEFAVHHGVQMRVQLGLKFPLNGLMPMAKI